MRRWLLCLPLTVVVLTSLLLVELYTPSEARTGGPLAEAGPGSSSILQPFETVVRGEGRLERARRALVRKRSKEASIKSGAKGGGASLRRLVPSKKNASDRSLQQVGGVASGAAERRGTAQEDRGRAAAGRDGQQSGVLQEVAHSEATPEGNTSVGACFRVWVDLTAAQAELQEALQLKWQANRQHDEAWFLVDRLERLRYLAADLHGWYLNQTQAVSVTDAGVVDVELEGLLGEARAKGVPVSSERQHAWEEWHYINYHFPAGTSDAVRRELRAAEVATKQRLEEQEARLRTAGDVHYRLKARFAGECVREDFPPALLASVYSVEERGRWVAVHGGKQGAVGRDGVGAFEEEPHGKGADAMDGGAVPSRYGQGQGNRTHGQRELIGAVEANSTNGGESDTSRSIAAESDVGEEWRAGREQWFLQRDLFPGEKNVSFILQYFKHPDNVHPLVAALHGCLAQMPTLTAELLVNVDNPEDADVWMAARNASGDFVVPVFSHNVHEQRGYNRLARMATGAVLVFLQDDQLPPSDCSWLADVLAAYSHYPRLGVVGLNTGVYSSTQTGWRMNALNGDNVYLRSAAIGVDMQFVLEVDLAPFSIRRRVFDQLGGFNEAYSQPGEGAVFLDYELCIRAWLAGHHVAQVAMIPGMRQSGVSGTRSGKQLAIRMKNEGMNGVDFILRLAKYMPAIDKEVLRLNQQLDPVYPDYPRPWEDEPPWRDANVRPKRVPRLSLNRTSPL